MALQVNTKQASLKADSIDKERARLWSDPNTFATTLLALAVDDFGTEVFDFEPETIDKEIEFRYKISIPVVNKDKLFAIMVSLATNLFYVSVPTFVHVCNSLAGTGANFHLWDPVDSHEAAWGITEVALNDPPQQGEDFKSRFSTDVRNYVNIILKEEGIKNPPQILQLAENVAEDIEQADTSFSDDPIMFKAFYQNEAGKTDDIKKYVKGQLTDLILQLDQITIHDRDHKRWQNFVSKVRRGSHSKT